MSENKTVILNIISGSEHFEPLPSDLTDIAEIFKDLSEETRNSITNICVRPNIRLEVLELISSAENLTFKVNVVKLD